MKMGGRRISNDSIVWRVSGPVAHVVKQAVLVSLMVAASIGACWLVVLYANGLRDPRYLDGWMLAGGMTLQLMLHILRKASVLAPKSAARWRQIHIYTGYVLIILFLLHSDFSLPDTAFESALWAGFVLLTITGIFGTYLAWAQRAMGRFDENLGYERIPALRADLARDARALVGTADPHVAAVDLPPLPHDAWIVALYSRHLHEFFGGQRNTVAHLVGSQRPLKRLTDEIDDLSRYVDARAQDKLAAIRALVIEKNRLDSASVYLGLMRAWLMVHVPVTYGLIVLTVVHVVVVYAFSAGAR